MATIEETEERRALPAEESLLEEGKTPFRLKFTSITLKIFKEPTSWICVRMPGLRESLLRSNMLISPQVLVSMTLLFTLLSLPIALYGLYLFYVSRLVWSLAALSAPLVVFASGLMLPSISASNRAGAIDQEMHFVVGYICVLVGGGVAPFATLQRLSGKDIFPAIAREAKRILMNVDVFGMDPISALDRVARYNPNKAFSEFINGYTTILRTGGEVTSYMETKLKDILAYRITKIKGVANTIGTFAEAYITVSTILGISIYVLFAVQLTLAKGSQATNVVMLSVMVPCISVMFIFFVHCAQPKEPFSARRAYRFFAASSLAIPLFLLLPLPWPLYTKLGLGLALSTIPPAIVDFRQTSQERSIESMLPNLVRDLAEVRKTGLSPERGIELIAERPYGGLTKHLKSISSQLSWGVPLQVVLANFARGVRSWTARAITFLILEVVEIGGGSEKMFTDLADFIQHSSEIEKERRSLIKPYLITPYFGAVMVVVSILMVMKFMFDPSLSVESPWGGSDLQNSMSVLLAGAILQAWTMGLAAGKMGEGFISSGFKHSTALALVSLVCIYVVGLPL